MQIRQLREEDANEVADVIKRALLEINSMYYPEEQIKNQLDNYTPENILAKSKRSLTVVAIDDKIIGTGRLKDNHISGVFVDPDYHKKGAGKEIMHSLERTAKEEGYETIQLGSSIPAVGFYQRLGYSTLREEHDQYAGRIILMQKRL